MAAGDDKRATPAATVRRALLSIDEIAMNIPHGSESTVRGWLASGVLPSRRIGRRRLVSRAAVAEFLGVPEDALVTG